MRFDLSWASLHFSHCVVLESAGCLNGPGRMIETGLNISKLYNHSAIDTVWSGHQY